MPCQCHDCNYNITDALFCIDKSQNYLSVFAHHPTPPVLTATIQPACPIGRYSCQLASPLQVPQVCFCDPSGPGCPGNSPSFRPQTSQLGQAHSLEAVLNLEAP